ncbi:DUF3017 domain-containing protein [Streptomyces sp. NBC_00859]|nr:DUF3017 domain-containing protein [Streptomyces sp. NBC_00859]
MPAGPGEPAEPGSTEAAEPVGAGEPGAAGPEREPGSADTENTEPGSAATDSAATGGATPEGGASEGVRLEGDLAEPEGEDAVSAPGPDGEPVRTTRRFPRVTRDTARPEGGGRAASSDAPAPARQWPLLTVLVTIGVGLLLVAFDVTRVGLLLVGAALIGGAVMRWWVRSVGMLAVRSRFTDMVTYGVLGVVITLLALMVQPQPWLTLPFLEGLMRITVR